MKKITHAVDEDPPRLAPSEWEFELVALKRDRESVSISRIAHRPKPHGEPFRVAILATRTYFRAACDWIPSRVGPLDTRVVSHRSDCPDN
jgi:hypothetical protein